VSNVSGLRLLVVEDETMIAMLLEDILDDLGCSVAGPVADVPSALGLLERESVDAAILDVNLDGQPSYAVADALAARGIPFGFITGYGASGLDGAYADRPVIQKPFTRPLIEELIGKLAPTPLPQEQVRDSS
jgi:CheY-like chemotaxis protein